MEAGMTGRAHRRRSARAAIAAVLSLALFTLLPAAASAKTVWGETTAEPATTPGFEGYWHYELVISWNTAEMGGHGMSHVGFFLSLGVCDCACSPDIVRFDDEPGFGEGEGGCLLSFIGLYECEGDPHYPERGATVKFEHDESGCEPASNGTAYLDFYSIFPPGEPQVHIGTLGIKAGTYTSEGAIVGVLPLCECGNPVEPSSWGVVKALYRR
jgi:hypothetical protein